MRGLTQHGRYGATGTPLKILGEFPLHHITHVGVSPRIDLKLFGREIIFQEFQPM